MAKNGSAVKNSLVGVAAIGDSVMLGASPALRKDLPNIYIDAKVSRYVGDGLAIAEDMDRKGRLDNIVLIGLGTNGPLTGYYEPQTKALLDFLTKNPNRQVFWINDYAPSVSWEKGNNHGYWRKGRKLYWKGNRKDKEVEVGRCNCREETREDYGFCMLKWGMFWKMRKLFFDKEEREGRRVERNEMDADG